LGLIIALAVTFSAWMVTPVSALSTTDGLRMVYWQNGTGNTYNVWRVEGNLAPQQVPLNSSGNVSLSPDGSTIAYTPYVNGAYVLALSDIYGQNARTIYVPPRNGDPNSDFVNRPEWSPDGQRLLFECEKLNDYPNVANTRALCSINRDGTGFRMDVNWGGFWPSYSADGTKLVFANGTTPSGTQLSGFQLFVTNVDGSNPRQLTTVSTMTEAYEPTYGTGGQVVFSGCKVAKKNQLCGNQIIELYSIQDNGTNLRRLTTNTTYDASPNWFTSASGPRVVYTGGNPGGSFSSMRPDGTDIRPEGAGASGEDAHFAANNGVSQQLLQRYVPVLRYYQTETYEADSVATITDNYVSGGFDETNKLQIDPSSAIATANPTLGYPQLSLSYLGQRAQVYFTGDDWIDEHNDYAADAQRMHGDPAYRNRVYGRVATRPSGGWVLQYWFFYYYNPKTYFTFGEHEGDWEMVQLEVTSAGSPVRASYAQHTDGETCDWIHVPRDQSQRPIAYVAEGSHANYFSSGYHFNGGANDYTSDQGEQVAGLQLTDITSLAAQPWTLWEGKYGSSGNSPHAPIKQGAKWDSPTSWADGVSGCTEGQTFP
jgi:Tol biopolymer transport system component